LQNAFKAFSNLENKKMATKITHLAIIPDGNRRWAKNRGLQAWKGHTESVQKTIDFIKKAFKLGIKYVTFWTSSYDNLSKRPKEEVYVLESIFKQSMEQLIKDKDIHDGQVKVTCLGEWRDLLRKDTIEAFIKAEEATKNYNNHHLTFLIGYNGDREMIRAIKNIADCKNISPEMLKQNLWTKDLPPVDLVIRTGGEPHLSTGFMMWDIKDAQLYFSEKLWPDFTNDDLTKAVEDYESRNRRFGK